MIDLMHQDVAEDRPAPGDRSPLGLARETAAAAVACREAVGPAAAAPLDDELVPVRGGEEGRHLGADLRERLRGAHDASRASTSVEWVERTPPFPETSATSCRAT